MRLFASIVAGLIVSSCTTMPGPFSRTVAVRSDPAGAAVEVACDGREPVSLVTPGSVRIRSRANGCFFTFSKDGYETTRLLLHRRTSATEAKQLGIGPGDWVFPTETLSSSPQGVSVEAIFSDPTRYERNGISVSLKKSP